MEVFPPLSHERTVRLEVVGQATGPELAPGNLQRFAHLRRRHPCIGPEAHARSGRIHLPVSPTCNIRCRFCRRGLRAFDQRPGVARALLSPADAVARVERALELCPDTTVVGVAGPGDSLATPHALAALRAVAARFPDLILCLSTNGLELAQRADELAAVRVHVVTVTVNAVAPEVLTQIVSSVRHRGRTLRGLAGAEALISAQADGIARVAAAGTFVKVNTVLIPGVNLQHVTDVARACAAWGAQQINLIPLIPQHEFAHFKAPSCAELAQARQFVAAFLPVFRQCRQCRADACGVPGREDLGPRLYEPTFSHG